MKISPGSKSQLKVTSLDSSSVKWILLERMKSPDTSSSFTNSRSISFHPSYQAIPSKSPLEIVVLIIMASKLPPALGEFQVINPGLQGEGIPPTAVNSRYFCE